MLYFSGFMATQFPATRVSAVRIVTLSKTSALYRIRSSMAVSLSTAEDFSPLDSFTSILRKLATKEFASEILPRHHVIRQQIAIEALLQSTAELQSLCAVLHKKIYDVISRLPAQKGREHLFQVALWPKFPPGALSLYPRRKSNVYENHSISK